MDVYDDMIVPMSGKVFSMEGAVRYDVGSRIFLADVANNGPRVMQNAIGSAVISAEGKDEKHLDIGTDTSCMSISEHCNYMAVSTKSGTVQVFDTQTPHELFIHTRPTSTTYQSHGNPPCICY